MIRLKLLDLSVRLYSNSDREKIEKYFLLEGEGLLNERAIVILKLYFLTKILPKRLLREVNMVN